MKIHGLIFTCLTAGLLAASDTAQRLSGPWAQDVGAPRQLFASRTGSDGDSGGLLSKNFVVPESAVVEAKRPTG